MIVDIWQKLKQIHKKFHHFCKLVYMYCSLSDLFSCQFVLFLATLFRYRLVRTCIHNSVGQQSSEFVSRPMLKWV